MQYMTPQPASSTDPTALLSALISTFSLGTGGTGLESQSAEDAFNAIFTNDGPWIGSGMYDNTVPRAYLNYILFDENFIPVDLGFDQVTTAGASAHDLLSLHVKVKQKGYLYVYLSNEQTVQTNVYWDDFKIVKHSGVVQVEDYYPFGATFNELNLSPNVDQNQRYQRKEWTDDMGLDLYNFHWRQYDPYTARTTTMDPHADRYHPISPYSWVINNPVRIVDPDGRDIHVTGQDAVNLLRHMQREEARQMRQERRDRRVGRMITRALRKEGYEVGGRKHQESAVTLDLDGNVKTWNQGASKIYVDMGNDNREVFHRRLVESGKMSLEAFSQSLLNIVDGMPLPEETTFDRRKLLNGKIALAMKVGDKIVTYAGGIIPANRRILGEGMGYTTSHLNTPIH